MAEKKLTKKAEEPQEFGPVEEPEADETRDEFGRGISPDDSTDYEEGK